MLNYTSMEWGKNSRDDTFLNKNWKHNSMLISFTFAKFNLIWTSKNSQLILENKIEEQLRNANVIVLYLQIFKKKTVSNFEKFKK